MSPPNAETPPPTVGPPAPALILGRAAAAVSARTSRATYERALAACSRILLVERESQALERALPHLLEATRATEVYVDANYQDSALGLCARSQLEIAREGFEHVLGTPSWVHFAYSRIPTCYRALSQGKPALIWTRTLTGGERDYYETAGVRSELSLPITVDGEWLGAVGFADHRRERTWSTREIRLLTTVAEMIGAFWVRGRHEQALRDSEARFRQLVEASPQPIIVHAGGQVVYANGAAAQLMRAASTSDLLGREVIDFVHPDSRDTVLARMRSLIVDRQAVEPIEERFIRLDGTVTDVEVSALPVIFDGVPAAQVLIRDIHAQKAAQRQLEDLVRQKDQFLASISHELRTPLTAVLGLADQLSAPLQVLAVEETSELIEIIADQAGEMSHIIEDLLVEARADLGTLAIRSQPVDLGREVDMACVGFQGVEIAAADRPTVTADPYRVRQILRNLLSNAARYGGGRITVTVDVDGSSARVAVLDDGEGIPADQIEAIFEPYQRAHTVVSQPASIGLGLTVSRKLARLMGGDVTYRRTDAGSSFELTLPLSPA